MAKTSPKIAAAPQKKDGMPTTPWACNHHATGSNIDAYFEASHEWATILTAASNEHFDARTVAERIVTAINNEENYLRIMEELASVLESCLEKERLDWSTEHDSEIALDRYRSIIKARLG